MKKDETVIETLAVITNQLQSPCEYCESILNVRKVCLPLSISFNNKSQLLPLCKECYTKLKEKYSEISKQNKNSGIVLTLPDMDQINSQIFIGNSDSGKDYKLLTDSGITHILIVGNFLFAHYPNDFIYKIIEVEDSEEEDISIYFEEAFEFMNSIGKSGKLLVHCFAGASRSASFVIAYLMQKDKKPYPKVYSYVKNKRNAVQINNGFKNILINFDIELNKRNYTQI